MSDNGKYDVVDLIEQLQKDKALLVEALKDAATNIEYYANNNVETDDELNAAYLEADKYNAIADKALNSIGEDDE